MYFSSLIFVVQSRVHLEPVTMIYPCALHARLSANKDNEQKCLSKGHTQVQNVVKKDTIQKETAYYALNQYYLFYTFSSSRHRKRSDPPNRKPPARPSDTHCIVHSSQSHGSHVNHITHGNPALGSPVLSHYSPREVVRGRGPIVTDSPERRRRTGHSGLTGHSSLTNISRHESLKKMESPPIRRSTSSGQYLARGLDPESIAQVSERRHPSHHVL